MSYADNLWLYTVFVLGIMVVPGMDMLFVLASALSGGRSLGLAATAGVMLGGAMHTLLGALGVGILLHWSPALFNLLLLAGAGYMVWIGWTLLRSSISVEGVEMAPRRSVARTFRQGLVTCLLNPKAYLFVLSVFPQFIKPQYGPLWQQGLMIGLITVLAQLVIYGGLALGAARSRDLLVSRPRATTLIGRGAGAMLIAVALLTVWQGFSAARF